MVEGLRVRPPHSAKEQDMQLGTSLVADSRFSISEKNIIDELSCGGDRRNPNCIQPPAYPDRVNEFAMAKLGIICSECPMFTSALRASLDTQETEVLARYQK